MKIVTYSFRVLGGKDSGTDVKPAFRQDTSLSRSQWQLLTHGAGVTGGISSVDDESGLNEGNDDVTDIRKKKIQNVFFISKRRMGFSEAP